MSGRKKHGSDKQDKDKQERSPILPHGDERAYGSRDADEDTLIEHGVASRKDKEKKADSSLRAPLLQPVPYLEPVDVHRAAAQQSPIAQFEIDESEVKKKKDLLTFPKASRAGGYVAKVLWGLLLGAGTIVGIMALVPTAHFVILGLLVVGAVAFTVKSVRETYKKHQEEKEAIEDLKKEIEENITDFVEHDLKQFNKILGLIDSLGHSDITNDEKEQLYAHVCHIENTQKKLANLAKAQNANHPKFEELKASAVEIRAAKAAIFLTLDQHSEKRTKFSAAVEKNKEVKAHYEKIALRDKISLDEAIKRAPLSEYMLPPIRKKEEPGWFSSPGNFFKKLANRTIEFAGGFSAGVAVGVGILSFVAGAAAAGALLSNPVGWAMLGIIAGAAVVGVLAVGVNYLVNRKQQQKIDSINHQTAKLKGAQSTLRSGRLHVNSLKHKVEKLTSVNELQGSIDQRVELAATKERELAAAREAQLAREAREREERLAQEAREREERLEAEKKAEREQHLSSTARLNEELSGTKQAITHLSERHKLDLEEERRAAAEQLKQEKARAEQRERDLQIRMAKERAAAEEEIRAKAAADVRAAQEEARKALERLRLAEEAAAATTAKKDQVSPTSHSDE